MSLIINHNLAAMNSSQALGRAYTLLARATERLSTGLRINSASDDAAGLAIRELMRADISVMDQGIRNASDGISMIQTAEGAMSIINEKLTRMKELAEQAATGHYGTLQRSILNSEYQAMAAEIDRIANATEFNGIKLLDGSISEIHRTMGLKVHFGNGNSSAEDYYFVDIGDIRATSDRGLRVGGDAEADIWRQLDTSGQGVLGLNSVIAPSSASAGAFIYYANYIGENDVSNANLSTPSYLAGIYDQSSGSTLQDLISSINQGSASRVQINFTDDQISALALDTIGHFEILLGNEMYQFGAGAAPVPVDGKVPDVRIDVTGRGGEPITSALAAAIEGNSATSFHPVIMNGKLLVFHQNGGDNDHLIACECQTSALSAAANVSFTNMETWDESDETAQFALGGEHWFTAGYELRDDRYLLSLTGTGLGENYDMVVGDASALSSAFMTLDYFGQDDFTELQNASEGQWDGAHIRTQSHAQEALEALQAAIEIKDTIRAGLGATQNRLENTYQNLGVMAENLQASESRISDVDVSTEITEFTRQNILSQTAAAMLTQANSIPELALSLLG